MREPSPSFAGRSKLLVTAVVGLGLLTGCGHPAPPAAATSTDQLGSLEASVDAIAGQVQADSSG